MKARVLLFFFASLTLGELASAQTTIDLYCQTVAPPLGQENVTFTYANSGGTATATGPLGVIGFSLVQQPTASDSTFYTFCIDLSQVVYLNGGGPYHFDYQHDLTMAPVTNSIGHMDAAQAAELSDLYGMVFGPYGTNYDPTNISTYRNTSVTPSLAVFEQAFQLAVTDIVYGDGRSVNDSRTGFWVSSANLPDAITQANYWLGKVPSGYVGDTMELVALTNGEFQDQLLPAVVANEALAAIPEPSTYAAIAGLGAIVFAVIRRRHVLSAA